MKKLELRSSLLHEVTQRKLVHNCRRLGTAYRCHLQWSSCFTIDDV